MILQNIMIAFVAVLHVGFFVLERFLWSMPLGQKIFKLTPEQAASGSVMAANQGVYNLLLAVGLIWSLTSQDEQKTIPVQYFILLFIIGVGAYGAATVGKNILFIQVFPAVIALYLLFANSAKPRINDISTSLENPPKISQTSTGPNEQEDATPGGGDFSDSYKAIHTKNYSYVKALSVPSLNQADTFVLVQKVFETFPSWKKEALSIDGFTIAGTETTQFFRFVDDFTIEVRSQGQGSEVHMRSRSRKGKSDFGKNSERILDFFDALRTHL